MTIELSPEEKRKEVEEAFNLKIADIREFCDILIAKKDSGKSIDYATSLILARIVHEFITSDELARATLDALHLLENDIIERMAAIQKMH